MKRVPGALVALIGIGGLLIGVCFGQYQTNTQLYGNPGPSIKYGWGPGYATPSSVELMPSENWNAFFKSGALPSELKYGYASAGPMAQGGIMAYLPKPGPQYQTGSVGTTGNYVNTAAGPTMGMAPPAVGYPVGGSVRYSPTSALAASAPPPAALISRGPIGPAPMSGAVAMPSGQRFSGSIRYGR